MEESELNGLWERALKCVRRALKPETIARNKSPFIVEPVPLLS